MAIITPRRNDAKWRVIRQCVQSTKSIYRIVYSPERVQDHRYEYKLNAEYSHIYVQNSAEHSNPRDGPRRDRFRRLLLSFRDGLKVETHVMINVN
jgi:hypothetical protein